jgi:RNA polymerase sigma factor (sigma-70 family)
VAQETLIVVAKKIGEFKHAGNRGSFRAWLYQQARWRIADQFRLRARANRRLEARPLTPSLSAAGGEGDRRSGERKIDAASIAGSFEHEASGASAPEVDPAFERLWAEEWEEHVRQFALARVKRQVSARQFQLFDLHALQGLTVRVAAKAAGTTIAAVYMAKSRVGRLVRREVARLRDFQE